MVKFLLLPIGALLTLAFVCSCESINLSSSSSKKKSEADEEKKLRKKIDADMPFKGDLNDVERAAVEDCMLKDAEDQERQHRQVFGF